ncbi:MAG: TonB-dependent receptor [Alphaproteobacteria bacterium]
MTTLSIRTRPLAAAPGYRPGPVSHRIIATIALGAATLVAPQFAAAQATGGDKPVELPSISVEGTAEEGGYRVERPSSPKYTEPLRDVPQTITIVPREVMDDRAATTLRDVLRNVPGITIAAGEGGVPMGDNLTIRGFAARTDMFVDGMRDFGNYFRDPFNLEQVEVVKGPSSSYSGRGSTGGSVNQVSKTPFMDRLVAGSVTVGDDMTKRATADINQPLTDWDIEGAALRINVMAHDQDVNGRKTVEKQRWGFAPSLALGLGTPTEVTLSYFHLSQDNIPDYGHPYANLRPIAVAHSNFYGLKFRDYEETSADLLTAEVEHRFDDTFSLRNQTRYGWTTSDYIVSQPTGANIAAGTISRNSKSRDAEDTILANQTDLTSRFDTAGLGHTLVTGAEVVLETTQNRLRQNNVAGPVTSLWEPDPSGVAPGVPYTGARTEADGRTLAIYAFDTVKIDDQWEVSGSLRYDNSNVDQTTVSAGAATTTNFSHTDEVWSWRLGGVFKPVAHGSIYAAMGTSFNTAGERLSLNANTVSVDPERNDTYELGTKWDMLDEQLSLTAAIFRTEKTNARTDDPFGGTQDVLEGKQRVDGIEFGVAGNVTKEWKLFAGYTYLDDQVVSSNNANEVGRRLVNVADHSFSLWSTYMLPWWGLEVGGGVQHLSSRAAGNAESSAAGTSNNSVEGYWIYDAMIAWHATENVTLQLNANNLLDTEYYEGVYSSMAHPGPLRTILFTTSFKY